MRWIVAVEQLYQLLGVLGAVRVGDADALIVRLTHHLVVLLCQRLDGVLSAAGLFKADDLALGVTFKNRLYVQNGRDCGLYARKPSGSAQVFQIVDREYLTHIVTQLINLRRVFLDAHAASAVLRRLDGQQPLAERRAERIYGVYLAGRELLAQLIRGYLGGVIRAAYAGRHADEKHVLPLFQKRSHCVYIGLRRDLRGDYLRAAAHRRVKRRAVKCRISRIKRRLAVNHVGQRQLFDLPFLEFGRFKIRGCICHYDIHNIFLLVI